MSVVPIPAKTLMIQQRQPLKWFGVHYTVNLYRGCQHRCVYCDSRSQRYEIEHFDTVLEYKENAHALLKEELVRKRFKRVVGTGSMGDPYTPAEDVLKLTRGMLELLHTHRWPVHIMTKSDLLTRDLDLIGEIAAQWRPIVGASCCWTITTLDETLARIIEPGAPSPMRRMQALKAASAAGAFAGMMICPVLPFLLDKPTKIVELVRCASDHGASYVVMYPSVTLRDKQRLYFYEYIGHHFPSLPNRYQKAFGDREHCESPYSEMLYKVFARACQERGLLYRMEDIAERISDREEQLRWV